MQIASDQPKFLEYRIKAGDTLALIISRFYGAHSGTNEYARRISEIMTLNPHLPNPDRIMTGDILILTTASGRKCVWLKMVKGVRYSNRL